MWSEINVMCVKCKFCMHCICKVHLTLYVSTCSKAGGLHGEMLSVALITLKEGLMTADFSVSQYLREPALPDVRQLSVNTMPQIYPVSPAGGTANTPNLLVHTQNTLWCVLSTSP